jgi:hypothetical protein
LSRLPFVLAFSLGLALPAAAEDLTLRMPDGMLEAGFQKQILPRFKFKHRLTITAVTEGEADMVFGAVGTRIFSEIDGVETRLDILTEDPVRQEQAALFLKWLKSASGKAAVEGFKPDGNQVYTTEVTAVLVEAPEVFDGDTAQGSRLALVHCGRCHVVDKRNRMGGIGSSPSFAALRGRSNWSDLFRTFFVHNPHPSFTQVEGVTEPFDPNRQIHVAPMDITLDEIEAITAFVATIEPKQLGQPVQSN